MKPKRIIAIFLVLLLMLTSCAKGDSSASVQPAKGRFVEHEITLPKDISKDSNLQLTKRNGMPFIYVIDRGETPSITSYQMNQDGTWTENTSEWLKDKKLPIKNSNTVQIINAKNGNEYLYYTRSSEEGSKGNLIISKDKKTFDPILIKDWNEKDPTYGIYYAPEKVNVLEDGTIVGLFFGGEIKLYDKQTYTELYHTDKSWYTNSFLCTIQNKIILGQRDNNDNIVSIDIMDTANNYNTTSYPFSTTLSNNYSYLDVNETEDLLLCNTDGIHILEHGSTVWQTILDGTLTSLTMHSLWSVGFIAGSDQNYYILYNSQDGYRFMKYTYDKTVDTIPSTELTIFSLKEEPALRQAAAVFQQKHTDVKVNFHIAMTNEEYDSSDVTIKEDYIRALNTELLSGGGPDILVLDGLPADSFIEKGILSDISDIVIPKMQQGELFPNIINSYVTDSHVYRVPTRFALSLLFSRTIDSKSISTIETLATYSRTHKNDSLLGTLTWGDLIDSFSPFLTNAILNQGEVKKEALVDLLNNLRTIGDSSTIIDESSKDERMSGMWELASKCQLTLRSIQGFGDSLFSFGIETYVNGNSTLFENSFTPIGELGILKASKKQNLSKEFLSLVLSEEIQKYDYYDGFAINTKAFDIMSQSDMSSYEASSEIENADGSYSYIEFKALNKDRIKEISNLCNTVSNRIELDEKFIRMFKNETKAFFEGTISAETAADQVIKKLSTYLSE